jgi:hypothetical protein
MLVGKRFHQRTAISQNLCMGSSEVRDLNVGEKVRDHGNRKAKSYTGVRTGYVWWETLSARVKNVNAETPAYCMYVCSSKSKYLRASRRVELIDKWAREPMMAE